MELTIPNGEPVMTRPAGSNRRRFGFVICLRRRSMQIQIIDLLRRESCVRQTIPHRGRLSRLAGSRDMVGVAGSSATEHPRDNHPAAQLPIAVMPFQGGVDPSSHENCRRRRKSHPVDVIEPKSERTLVPQI